MDRSDRHSSRLCEGDETEGGLKFLCDRLFDDDVRTCFERAPGIIRMLSYWATNVNDPWALHEKGCFERLKGLNPGTTKGRGATLVWVHYAQECCSGGATSMGVPLTHEACTYEENAAHWSLRGT